MALSLEVSEIRKPFFISFSTNPEAHLNRLSVYFSKTAAWCLRGFSQQPRICEMSGYS